MHEVHRHAALAPLLLLCFACSPAKAQATEPPFFLEGVVIGDVNTTWALDTAQKSRLEHVSNAGGAAPGTALLFVDASRAGTDDGDGSARSPFATITEALAAANALPPGKVHIHISAGRYSEKMNGEVFPLVIERDRVELRCTMPGDSDDLPALADLEQATRIQPDGMLLGVPVVAVRASHVRINGCAVTTGGDGTGWFGKGVPARDPDNVWAHAIAVDGYRTSGGHAGDVQVVRSILYQSGVALYTRWASVEVKNTLFSGNQYGVQACGGPRSQPGWFRAVGNTFLNHRNDALLAIGDAQTWFQYEGPLAMAGANHVEVIGNHFVTSLNQPATAGIARGIYGETAAEADLDYVVSDNSFMGPSRYAWRSFSSQIGHETLFSLPLCSSSFVRSRVALTLGGNLYDGYTVNRAQVSFVATSAVPAISCALRQAAFIVDDAEDELLGTHALDAVNPSAPAGTPPYGNLLEVNGMSLPL